MKNLWMKLNKEYNNLKKEKVTGYSIDDVKQFMNSKKRNTEKMTYKAILHIADSISSQEFLSSKKILLQQSCDLSEIG